MENITIRYHDDRRHSGTVTGYLRSAGTHDAVTRPGDVHQGEPITALRSVRRNWIRYSLRPELSRGLGRYLLCLMNKLTNFRGNDQFLRRASVGRQRPGQPG